MNRPVPKTRNRPGGAVVVLAAVSLTACNPGFPTIAPEGLADLDRETVREWVSGFSLHANRMVRIRPWRYINDRGSASGRAVVRIAAPDSMRFDFRAPFGKSGAAMIVNDDALWAHPEGDFSPLIRIAPVFWASIGLPLQPPVGVRFVGMNSGDTRVWRYGFRGDTLTFVAEGDPVRRLRSEMRRDGETFALSEVLYDSVTHLPTGATVDFPLDPGRFTFEIQSIEDGVQFESDVWEEP